MIELFFPQQVYAAHNVIFRCGKKIGIDIIDQGKIVDERTRLGHQNIVGSLSQFNINLVSFDIDKCMCIACYHYRKRRMIVFNLYPLKESNGKYNDIGEGEGCFFISEVKINEYQPSDYCTCA